MSLVKIASISRPFLGNKLALLPEKTTGSEDLLLSTSTNVVCGRILERFKLENLKYLRRKAERS